ncbi:hypothetical protein SAMN03097699_0791 [Flavobacteriaceae bacterium MAR_2010_188]|nr:hypothetical protein SAMN03097699_0791 [Flavobacteriaceae bacterium MAR_2010_188]
MKMEGIENTPIKNIFWKDEILQVLYWMKGEGLGKTVALQEIIPFLNTSEENLNYHLLKLHKEGFLKSEPDEESIKFSLSETGNREGAKHFAEAFQGMQKAGHGECGPDCEFCYGTDGVKLDNCVHNCAS